MRYCRRTLFNKVIQPRRIGKRIPSLFDAVRTKRYQPKRTMLEFRRGKTPRNMILARYSMVRYFKLYQRLGIRVTQSIFVRRAKRNEPVKILDI